MCVFQVEYKSEGTGTDSYVEITGSVSKGDENVLMLPDPVDCQVQSEGGLEAHTPN